MGLLKKLYQAATTPPKQPKVTVTISDDYQPLPQAKRQFSDNDPALLESLNTTETFQPTQKLPLSDVCPYCGVVQSKPIGRKKNCSDCKQPIYVRTTQDLFPNSALTKDQVNDVDFYMALKNVVMATKDDYLRHEKRLQKEWNTPKVNTYDVLWSMYNDVEMLKRGVDKDQTGKWGDIRLMMCHQMTTFNAAQYQAGRGHDPTPYLKTALSYSLKMARLEDNVKGLTVQSYACCDNCSKFHDKTFTLDFIEKTPVLPVKTCTHPAEDGSKYVYCTCTYQNYYEW